MLFYLTKSLIINSGNNCYNDLCFAVENIAIQAFNGYHLLTGDIEVIEYFRSIFSEQSRPWLIFNSIYQEFSIRGVPRELTFYIEVVLDQPVDRHEGPVFICQKLYSDYIQLDFLIKTRLICEDLNDANFYEHILSWFVSSNRFNLSYSLHLQQGGGRNIPQTVQQELSQKHITICIIDMDKRYANYSPPTNSTYSQCANLGSTADHYMFLKLEVHEVENLIPLNYIDKAFPDYATKPSDKSNKIAFDCLRNDAENILPYFDYKKGVRKDHLFASDKGYRDFAENCYNQNPDRVDSKGPFVDYVATLSCGGEIYPPLIAGTGTIKMILDLIKKNDCPDPKLLDFQLSAWNEIGQAMLNWCVSKNTEAIH